MNRFYALHTVTIRRPVKAINAQVALEVAQADASDLTVADLVASGESWIEDTGIEGYMGVDHE